MRKTLIAAAALGLLLSSAACSSGSRPASTAGTAGAASPGVPYTGRPTEPRAATPADPKAGASADAALSADTKAICAQAGRTGTTFGTTFIADLKLELDARNKSAQARARAEQKTGQDVSDYSYALADMSKLAADPALKSALKQMSDQVTAFAGDVTKINADRMSELSGTLDKACGKR